MEQDSIAVEQETPSVKIGDKVYTPEEIQKLEASRDFFQTESQKAKEQLKTLEATATKADEVISGESRASELTQAEMDDLKYMSKLGFISKEKMEEVVRKVKEDTQKEVEEKLTKKERLEKTESEIDKLSSQHTFIDKEELKKFMSEEAVKFKESNGSDGAIYSSPEKAARELYFDKFIANGIKPAELPSFDKTGKSRIEDPKPKVLDIDSKELNDLIRERLTNNVE